MNNQLIEKVIKTNNEECPEITFENPLIDQNVTKALSKSFVKILNVSQSSSKINTNLRLSILENIRKICKIEPDDHVKIEENLLKLLSEFHCTNLNERNVLNSEESVKKALDAFLLRRIEDCEITSSYRSNLNPEVIQSLINLKQNEVFNTLSDDVIHWDIKNSKYMRILKDVFQNENIFEQIQLLNDISIKMIPEIEKIFLETCLHIIGNNITDFEDLFCNNDYLQHLGRTCAVSSKCFKICTSVLNFIFITSNFDIKIRNFISMFIQSVKSISPHIAFTVLYPTHLGHAALILDFNVEILPLHLREIYIQRAIYYLKRVHKNNENDLIMLLSHFPNWFDIYYDPKYSNKS